jgi:hypothetical protein
LRTEDETPEEKIKAQGEEREESRIKKKEQEADKK